jgi:hypothetical protein
MSPLTKLASLTATLGLAVGSAGCFFDQSSGGSGGGTTAVPEVSIDTGAQLSVTAGQLQGIFVQYGGGGDWSVYTSCDTVADGNSCVFDITLSTSDAKGFTNPTGTALAPNDTVTLEKDGSIETVFHTSSALDGVTFTTTAGAVLEVDANLNGASVPKLVNWISGKAVQNGTPANPCDFVPTAP